MTTNSEKFDAWIRAEFVTRNTELEILYGSLDDPEQIESVGAELKQALLQEGNALIAKLLQEGNTDEGFEAGYDLLGNVGLFMAACRRHLITEPERETRSPLQEASALAMQLGASLGVAPRFASAHLETHNRAINGIYKTFTSLDAERIFVTYNTRAALAFIRASDALRRVLPLGVSHPVTADLLIAAKNALQDVIVSNNELFEKLDVDPFFHSVRTYYKPHRVGLHSYRGANAGDFAGINVIDLLLGLCRADDAYYSQLLVDKFLFMTPEDQLVLRDCMRRQSLLDSFLESLDGGDESDEFRNNLSLFLEVCKAHGETALQHHNYLVNKFIEQPAQDKGLDQQADLTASGPPLPVLLKALRKLCDMRCAAKSDEIETRYADLQRLRDSLT